MNLFPNLWAQEVAPRKSCNHQTQSVLLGQKLQANGKIAIEVLSSDKKEGWHALVEVDNKRMDSNPKVKKTQSQCKNTVASKQQGLGLPMQGFSYKFLQIFKKFVTSLSIYHNFR